MVEDRQLVRLAKKGDRGALAALYTEYQPRIFRYIAYRVGDTAVADDLTAEVFVSMVKNIGRYEYRGRPFLAWLYTIAGNIVKMHYRRQQKAEFEPLPDEMIDHKPNPADITESRLTHERLMAAMPHLTEGQRQVILLKFIEGFDNSEIAAVMVKSEGAIRVLQHRALLALRRVLAEEASRSLDAHHYV
jgi:RNA polymerase sigma-70 factor (ECF subfamily)